MGDNEIASVSFFYFFSVFDDEAKKVLLLLKAALVLCVGGFCHGVEFDAAVLPGMNLFLMLFRGLPSGASRMGYKRGTYCELLRFVV